jgi:GMP synthase-like glutamine amidotransferase
MRDLLRSLARLYPRTMLVELVLTERRGDVDERRAANFRRLHDVLSGMTRVETSYYEELDGSRLGRADAVVVSGSTAAWSSRELVDVIGLGQAVLGSNRPVLGICAGMQLLTCFAGGAIALGESVEHGFLPIRVHDRSGLLRDLPKEAVVFHDHTDAIAELPDGFEVLASSDACPVQAFADPARRWWGTQFHPEESSDAYPFGARVLATFVELARR